MVSRSAFARSLSILLERGFRFTVIGGSVVGLAVGDSDLGDDIDLFAEDPSVLVDESEYYSLAEELGWILGQTWLGTPRLVARVGGEEVSLEFYDNLYDFYVPEEIILRAERVSVGGVRVKVVRVEDHIVLKANAGRSSDMDRLKEIGRLVKKGRLRIDKAAVEEAASLFEDEKVILRRLREVGVL